MSVVSCTLSREGRGGRFFVDAKGGVSGVAEVTWSVVTDDETDGWITVYLGAKTANPNSLPEMLDTYAVGGETEVNLYFQDATPTQDKSNRKQWKIKGTYRNLPFGVTRDDATINPLTRPWKFRIESEVVSVEITEGRNIKAIQTVGDIVTPPRDEMTLGPIVNSAQEEHGTTISQPRTREVLVASRNFETLEEIYTLQNIYKDSLNESEFLGFPKHHCEWAGMTSSDKREESDFEYFVGTIRIILNGKPQYLNAVNTGFKWFKNGKLVDRQAGFNNGEPLSEPTFLTASGELAHPTGSRLNSISYLVHENVKDYNRLFAQIQRSGIKLPLIGSGGDA